MASIQMPTHREGADIYHGAVLCEQKIHELLDEFHFPKGLMPLNNLVEVGYNRTTSFIWLKQQKTCKYWFKALGASSNASETTGFLEDRRIRKLTALKSKEMMLWVILSYISADETDLNKITCTAPMGLSKSSPLTTFEDEAEEMK